ncbi:hypothetical protein JMJ35_007031 [Cladonia borealis]|uniref:Uncharacterized protein n=1 Tax=Cladonia borealis TaxID=184061 RepID=A0AA39V402_9LECA|nr:hypothetical protein JMJ35_007031 [Cladonia borealis]
MPFLLILLWLLQHSIVALTLAVSSPAAASTLMILSATVPQDSVSNLTAAPSFLFRVPFSTIELTIVCTLPMDGRDLAWILLSLHDYVDEHLRRKGDEPLAPKNDPFGFQTDPPRVSFTAQSAPGRLMTWSVLQIAAEGIYLCLPQRQRYFGASFEIRDYQDDFQWGFGRVTAVPLDLLGIRIPNIITIGNDTTSANATEIIASEGVPVA